MNSPHARWTVEWAGRVDDVLYERLSLMRSADPGRLDDVLPEPRSNDPVECVHLNFVHGSTLLALAERDDDRFAPTAVARLAKALTLARQHQPEQVPAIKLQLCRAEHLVATRRNAAAFQLRTESAEL
jgi:hypothetical protein